MANSFIANINALAEKLDVIVESNSIFDDGVTTNASAVSVDEFFGSLGLTQYYPHQDNTYTGDLNGS